MWPLEPDSFKAARMAAELYVAFTTVCYVLDEDRNVIERRVEWSDEEARRTYESLIEIGRVFARSERIARHSACVQSDTYNIVPKDDIQ